MHRFSLIILILLFFLAGCSGGSSPVTPDQQESANLDNVPIINLSQAGDTFNAIGLMGAYEVIINPDEMTAELIAKRTSSIGESYIVSGYSFFNMWPCTDCLKISNISLDDDHNIVLGMSITHPFPEGDQFKPPTAMNRLDLDIFDVALLIAPQNVTPDIFTLTGASAYSGICVNPDGYTTELTDVIGDQSALPYFLVIDDSETGESTFNKFEMESSAEFNAIFGFDGTDELLFDFYLTFGYGFSARRPQRLEPKYYNPEFNRKVAWKVEVIPPGPAEMGSTWNDGDSVTEFDVEIQVYNWQQGATVYNDPDDFDNAPPDNIYAPSDVAFVSLEIPGMTNSLPTESDSISGSGMPDDPLVYMIPVANENLLEAGQYYGLVKVTDQRSPGVIGDRDYIIDTPDGILLYDYELPEYSTYQIFAADVVIGCGPITGDILDPVCPITSASNNSTINFVVEAQSDNDGDPIVLYEVDYVYDGVTFNPSDSNTDGVFNNVGPFAVPEPCEDNIPYDFTVAFRATDSCDPPNETIFATCTVTVDDCVELVNNVKITVNRLGVAGNHAIDGSKPWTISWDASAGAAEYAIYRDNDPSDGLDNNFELVGTTTDTYFDVPSSELPANRYVVGNTYTVRSRSVAGDPGSESPNSDLAFITVNGWETMSSGQLANEEGWRTHTETTQTSAVYRFRIVVTNVPHGLYSSQTGPFVNTNTNCHYHGMMKETPTVPNSSVRLLEAAIFFRQVYGNSGMIFGTSPELPTDLGWNNPEIVTWASVSSEGDYQGYNHPSPDVRNTFSGVPDTGNIAWNSTNLNSVYILFGGDLSIDGNHDDPYVAIQHANYSSTSQPHTRVDELAIVIY